MKSPPPPGQASAQLLDLRGFLDDIINSIADPVFVKDRQHRWILLNDACCRLIGRSREDLIGRSDYDYFPKEQADVFWAMDEAVFATGRPNANEEKITDAQGQVHTIVTKKSLYRDRDGNEILVGVIRDTTEQKSAEERLLFQSMLVASQQEASLDGILVVDEAGHMVSFNQRFIELWGIPDEVVAQRSDERALQSVLEKLVDPRSFLARVQYLYEHRDERSSEEISLLDGRTLDRYSAPISGPGGKYYGRVWYFRDITDRKRAEESLRESEARLQSVLDNMPAIVSIKDIDGRYIFVNRHFEELFGVARAEILGNRDEDILPRASAESWRANDQKVIETKSSLVTEEAVLREGGEPRTYLALKFALLDGFGKPYAVCGVHTDISERKKADEALRQKSEELARSNEELQLFASAASHDLQDPLRKIISFGELLQKRAAGALDETSRDMIERIRQSASRMSGLIQELLDLSRVVRDKRPFEPVDLNAVIADVLSDMETVVAETGAKIEVSPLPTLRAHPVQMRQLMQNLIGNAIKYRRKDISPRIEITCREVAHGFVELSIADNGIGFDEKHMERIFEPFLRLHSRAEYEGYGIGLATCRRIMLRHGGWIKARSTPGKGSVFLVTLPGRRTP